MDEHTATFEIDSSSDARTVARMIDELYNRVREENRSVRSDDPDETMAAFEALRSAVDEDAAGELVVTYRREEP